MPRPDSLADVVSLVRHSRVVDDVRLSGFLARLGSLESGAPPEDTPLAVPHPRLTPERVLARMVADGLLTRYQAEEIAAGRDGFWVGGYLILEQLGRGGMGQVFLARHPLLGSSVAVKVLSSGVRADAATRDRFVREARAAAAVDHPNVVRVVDVDAAHNPPFLVMEYVDGVSLQAAVARHGTFAPEEAAAVGVQVVRGLHYAAAAGLVHRDIKPANLLVDRKGLVKILDLGIARFAGEPISRRFRTAVVVGTLDYLAPEQAEDSSSVDSRADLYSLGATLYFLLAGHPPFPESDLGKKLALKQSADPTPLHTTRADVPPAFSSVVSRLLARHPCDRFQTPAEVIHALEVWAAPGPAFPSRLFLPPPIGPLPTPPECGSDSNPTPLPPTRRILHHHTHRVVPAFVSMDSSFSDDPPTDATPALTLPEHLSLPPLPDEVGGATIDLFPERRPSVPVPKTRWWVYLAAGLISAAALAAIMR